MAGHICRPERQFLQPRKRTGGQCALLNLKRRNPPPAFGWMTVGLHGPVFLRKHTVLSMARHIQVNRDWCPVIVPLVGPAQHCCQVIRNTHRWKQHYARPELPTEKRTFIGASRVRSRMVLSWSLSTPMTSQKSTSRISAALKKISTRLGISQ